MGNYKFGTGDENIAQLSVEKSYTVQIDVVDGTGLLKDIMYGGEENKISATKYETGGGVPDLGSAFSAGGVNGYVTKAASIRSNEDVSKIQIEAIGSPSVGS